MDLFRFNNGNGTRSCPHVSRVKEEHVVWLVPAEGAGDALRDGPGQKNFNTGKVVLSDLPCRVHAKAVGGDEFVPDTNYGQPAGVLYPVAGGYQRPGQYSASGYHDIPVGSGGPVYMLQVH